MDINVLSRRASFRWEKTRSRPSTRSDACSSSRCSRLDAKSMGRKSNDAWRRGSTTKDRKDSRHVLMREASMAAAALSWSLLVVPPSHAFDLSFFTYENIVQLGLVLGFYLVVGPTFTYVYLRKRWYNRSTLETMFQYFLVFFFFPGILLASPFVNLRPNDKGRML